MKKMNESNASLEEADLLDVNNSTLNISLSRAVNNLPKSPRSRIKIVKRLATTNTRQH